MGSFSVKVLLGTIFVVMEVCSKSLSGPYPNPDPSDSESSKRAVLITSKAGVWVFLGVGGLGVERCRSAFGVSVLRVV